MSQLLGQTLNTVIESYLHTPRPLRESEIVKEILAVFPEQDRTMLVEDLRERVRLINGFRRIMAGLAPAIWFLEAAKDGQQWAAGYQNG